ncbi:MAG: ABC transporter permease [Dehalococcoidia bacterium]
MIATAAAFFRRDLRIAMSYRITFVRNAVMLVFGLASMYFVARLVDQGAPPALARYHNDYFGYALIGVAFALFAQSMAGQFPAVVRSAQINGTLEVLFGSRTSAPVFLVSSTLFDLGYAVIRLILTLVIGAALLGAGLHLDRALLAALVFLLTAATFAGIGAFAAAFVLWFKQPEPFTGAIITASLVLSGVLYPTTVLPAWLRPLAPALPLTHTMSALRDTLLGSASTAAIGRDLGALAGFALLLPLGFLAFQVAVRQAKIAGSLSHY